MKSSNSRAFFGISILVLCGLMTGASTSAFSSDDGDESVIQSCLKHWGKHPFKGKNPEFRTISTKVKVIGIGKNTEDTARTEKPELILVKPTVAVMSKTTLKLMNPNGWYCVKGRVSVLGSNSLEIHCKAHLASSADGATILGSSDGSGSEAVTVLGSSEVKRVGCE
jgi:hypothetical protein